MTLEVNLKRAIEWALGDPCLDSKDSIIGLLYVKDREVLGSKGVRQAQEVVRSLISCP
jgi:hypothetical protein